MRLRTLLPLLVLPALVLPILEPSVHEAAAQEVDVAMRMVPLSYPGGETFLLIEYSGPSALMARDGASLTIVLPDSAGAVRLERQGGRVLSVACKSTCTFSERVLYRAPREALERVVEAGTAHLVVLGLTKLLEARLGPREIGLLRRFLERTAGPAPDTLAS